MSTVTAKSNKSNKSSSTLTTSGIELPLVASASDLPTGPERQTAPGEFPYLRGIYPDMYRGRLWTMRQYAGFGSALETNQRFQRLLAQGQTGLSVAFDLPTQIGYDSDHDLARGEVGRTGVAIDSLADMEALFDGISLAEVSTSMTINSTAVILLAMYVTVARKQGVADDKIAGTVQNDILKEFIARGTYIYPPRQSMRLIADILQFAQKNLPRYNTISISGYHIREAGATAVQEVAFTLANGIAYVQCALDAGLEIDQFAPRLSFFFAAHNNLFEEVAKFRAARMMWAKIVRDRFGSTSEKSQRLRFHTQTGGSTLTAQQPEINIVRTTVQALAAVMGGTQSLHTNSFDEALGLPTARSAKVALRTQQIIAEESGVPLTADPLGGSYLVEKLTSEIIERAEDLIAIIDEAGGAIAAVESGYFRNEIGRSAYQFQMELESQQRIIVGQNKYVDEQESDTEVMKVDPSLEKSQLKRLAELRQKRDNEKVRQALAELKTVAEGTNNIVPAVIEAVTIYATVGEISDALRETWGEYRAGGDI
ncbi:methylmalonyl-CoA mutase [bacterium AH-315-J21]|nr:methylmalonyl-CoA mutase [bacterium AH-315-J21]